MYSNHLRASLQNQCPQKITRQTCKRCFYTKYVESLYGNVQLWRHSDSILMLERSAEHIFWHGIHIFGLSDPWSIRKKHFVLFSFLPGTFFYLFSPLYNTRLCLTSYINWNLFPVVIKLRFPVPSQFPPPAPIISRDLIYFYKPIARSKCPSLWVVSSECVNEAMSGSVSELRARVSDILWLC